MERLVEHLIRLLQETEALYTRMLPMFDLEKKAALSADPACLLQVNEEKQNVLAELKTLDRQRAALLRRIAGELHLCVDPLTLTDLADQLPSFYGAQLKSINESLRLLFDRISRANDESRTLVVHCLSLVKNTLSFFSSLTGSTTIYGASGNMHSGRPGNGRLLSNSV